MVLFMLVIQYFKPSILGKLELQVIKIYNINILYIMYIMYIMYTIYNPYIY